MDTPIMVSDNLQQQTMSSIKRKAVDNDLETNFRCAKRQLCEVQNQNVALAPADVALQLFRENGYDFKKDDELTAQLPFIKPTPEMINSYQPEKITVVRKQDMEGVRALYTQGESFDACNRFGESLIHMACRRGCKEMVEFLVHEAKVNLFVRDDYGRTMLHDAFWTAEPNYELITLLIKEIPEFLCVRDVRGHTPLDYVRKNDYTSWSSFLYENKDLLVPRHLNKEDKETETK